MDRRKKKKPNAAKIDWPQSFVAAALDLLVGALLILINKLIG